MGITDRVRIWLAPFSNAAVVTFLGSFVKFFGRPILWDFSRWLLPIRYAFKTFGKRLVLHIFYTKLKKIVVNTTLLLVHITALFYLLRKSQCIIYKNQCLLKFSLVWQKSTDPPGNVIWHKLNLQSIYDWSMGGSQLRFVSLL